MKLNADDKWNFFFFFFNVCLRDCFYFSPEGIFIQFHAFIQLLCHFFSEWKIISVSFEKEEFAFANSPFGFAVEPTMT